MTYLRNRPIYLALTALALFSMPTLASAQSGQSASLNSFNGVWDTYGGISCRRGNAEPDELTIRDGKVEGTIQTTDNANRMVGKIDAYGRITVYVSGTFTLMTFKAVLIGHEGYGTAEATGDDVDCDGEWALRRRADPNVPDVHKTANGGTAPISPGYRSQSMSWNSQMKFRRLYETFRQRAADLRLKSIMKSR